MQTDEIQNCPHNWIGAKVNPPMEPDEWEEFCSRCGAQRHLVEGVDGYTPEELFGATGAGKR